MLDVACLAYALASPCVLLVSLGAYAYHAAMARRVRLRASPALAEPLLVRLSPRHHASRWRYL